MADVLPHKVLVVDHDDLFLVAVKQMLESQKIQALTANTWENGLYLFNQNKVEVAILEMDMPGLPATALIQKWRAHDIRNKRDAGFIVAVSRQKSSGSVALVQELEDIIIVEKPVSLPILISSLVGALKKSQAREKYNEVDYKVIEPLLKQQKYDKAMEFAKNNLESTGPKGVFKSALIHKMAGDRTRARELLEGLSAADPNSIKYYNELGSLNLEDGKIEEARKYFEKADKLAPLNIERLNQMAEMYLQAKEPEKSIEKMTELLDLNPEQPDVKFSMYEKLLKSGFEKHAQSFCKETSTPVELVRHFNNKGVMFSKGSQFEESLQEYEKALKLFPGNKANHRILFNMAISHINKKSPTDLAKAKALLVEALKLDPEFAKAKDKLAIVEKALQNNKAS